MGWRIDPTVGRRLRAAVATMEEMRRHTGVHRASMDAPRFRRFLGETLLLDADDLADATTISERLGREIGRPCEVPDAIAAANRMQANSTGLALSRHMGVDPVRLVLCAYDARARAVDGHRVVEASVRRALGAAARRGEVDEIGIKVTLARGVSWQGRRMCARSVDLPDSVLGDLPGRSMRCLTDHRWEGWDRISIVSAVRRGHSLIVDTDATGMEPVMSGVEGFEDGRKSR